MTAMLDFAMLPPEFNSARMSLIEASVAWQQIATDLEESAASTAAAVSSLTGVWQGPSPLAMTQAVEPYLTWLRTTAQQAQQTAASAQAAAAAFSAVSAAVVPVSQVTANRTGLAQLLATNTFGQQRVAGKPMRWDAKIAPWRGCQAAQPRMRGIETIDSEL
jgi:PPE-repeat protein